MVKKETKKNTASDKKDANLEKINALELQIKELEEAVLYAKA